MPFRHAHRWVIGFLPLIAFAFYPGYLARLQGAPLAFHLHGFTATLWLLSLALQSWSIHARQRHLHRLAGQASLFVFPFFFASFCLIVRQMAGETAAGDPFYGQFGAALSLVDITAIIGVGWFVFRGVSRRRKVHEHGGWLLATLILLIPPVVGRLPAWTPWLAINGPADFGHFAIGVQIGNAAALITALITAWRVRVRQPFMIAALLVGIGAILFEVGLRFGALKRAFISLAVITPATAFLAGLLSGAVIVTLAWRMPRGARAALTA